MKISLPLVLVIWLFGLGAALAGVPLLPAEGTAVSGEFQRARLPYVHDGLAYVVADEPILGAAQPLQYLGDGHFLFVIQAAELNTVRAKLSYIDPARKMLADLDLSTGQPSYPSVVVYAQGTTVSAVKSELDRLGIQPGSWNPDFNRVTCTASAAQLRDLAQLPFVLVISRNYPNKNPLIFDGMLMNRVTQVQEALPYGYDLKGEGTAIGIWDDGAIGTHFNLSPRRVFNIDKEYTFGIYTNHPTWVAGAAGMTPDYFNLAKGPAYRSKLFSWDYYNDIILEIRNGIIENNLNVTNHSYNFASTTCALAGLYIPEAANLDKLANEFPKVLHTVAVGNTGTTCLDTFNSVDIGYQGCKNSITVGWLFTTQTAVPNSGRGPTTDGRLKPDLTTKGFGVQTTSPGNQFLLTYGSSFAAPQVAGIISLLQQRYRQQFGEWPNASLVKAILCNTAQDLGNPGPDYTYGFGRPDALKAVRSIENNQFFESEMSQGSQSIHSFNVPSGTARVSITLNWTDKEGFPFADVVLVNDLDLKLVGPNNDTILPWKLDPVNYKKYAKRGVDQLNNTEQVTLDYPIPGVYTILVRGSRVPVGPQAYSVSYYTERSGIELTFPDGGELLDAGGSYSVHWNYIGSDTTVNIEYTTNGGQNWFTIMNNVNVRNRYYSGWVLPAAPSKSCKVRLTYGNEIDTSESYFSIGVMVNFGTISTQICDRTARISWGAVPSASAYRVYLFVDDNWVLQGETSGLNFTINNLINGKNYLYSISCIRDSVESNRSLAILISPTPLNCSRTNDAGIYALHRPQIGRRFTSMALGSAEKLSFIIRNFGTNSISGFTVRYSINGGPVRSQTLSDILVNNDTSIIQFNVNENLAAFGNYSVVAWTELPGETNTGNDTLRFTIRNLVNAPLTLPFTEGFESSSTTMTSNGYGVFGTNHLDYSADPGGRARTEEGNLYAHSGNSGLTLDNYRETTLVKNDATFTLNLSAYKDSTLYLDFHYMSRGEPEGNDKVYARGKDTDPWVEIYDLFNNIPQSGRFFAAEAIDLYRLLKIENGQDFSASTQIRIAAQNLRKANDPYAAGGYSFDDFRVYAANFDAELRWADLQHLSCQNSVQPLPLTVFIRNNSKDTLRNLPVSYAVANGTPVTELVPVNILPYDTLIYTFSQKITLTQPGRYSVSTWVSRSGDNYRVNDSITNLSTLVLPFINSFPYYNDLESDPVFIADGVNSSWTWGTPSKYFTRRAAQGERCWSNNLTGQYNYNENSSLYLGCYDFSALDRDPLLALHHLQNISTNSDTAYAETSSDGIVWERLGCNNCGDNWYTNEDEKDYWDETVYPWQVASTQIVRDSLDDPSNTLIRIRFISDKAGNGEGFPVDDIHIYTDIRDISATDSFYATGVSDGSGWVRFENNSKIIAELHDGGQALGNITLGYYDRLSGIPNFKSKNFMQRSWVVRTSAPPTGDIRLRLYVHNETYTDFVFEDDSTYAMGDISLLRYTGLNTNLSPGDNHIRSYYRYYTPDEIQFYPVKGGYYVEALLDTLGELYLIGSTIDPDAIPAINLVDLTVLPVNDDAYLEWQTSAEANSTTFVIQYSFDGVNFISLDTVPAAGNSTSLIDYNYIHEVNATNAVFYYRILITDISGNKTYSLIDSVRFASAVPVFTNDRYMTSFISGGDIVINNVNRLSGDYQVRVLRPDGALLFNRELRFTDGWNALGIRSFPGWANGAYLLEVFNERERYYSKLMKTP